MAKNYLTAEIKAAIIEAFEQAGGVEYLVEIAKRDPPTFCRLLAKLMAQFAIRRHGLAIAAARHALGDGRSPSSMRWNHLR